MRKRVKVSVPSLIDEILKQDMRYFGFTREKLCNIIVQEIGFEDTLKHHIRMIRDKKINLVFNLTERNTTYIDQMIKESGEEVESEYFRSLLSTYVNLHPSLRERIIKRNVFLELDQAIKNKMLVKISHLKAVLDIRPEKMERDSETGYNYLRAKLGEEVFLYKVKDIEVLKSIGF